MKAFGLIACTVTLLAACGSETGPPAPPPPDAATVTTGSAPPPRFIPQVATIAVGGTVTFHNGSPIGENGVPIVHNVKSGTNLWPLRSLEPDESFDVTFTEPGQYQFECTIHPGMTGVIAVQ